MKLIVSDSTTIITLLNIKRINLLQNIFEQVIIPPKVYDEITVDENIILNSSFFIKKEIKDKTLYKLLSKSLDKGESEAITLAKEINLPLIIDEKKGRKIASHLGIDIIGFIGLLLLSYQKKYLSKTEVLEIYGYAKKVNFRVSANLENQFLNL